MSNTLVENIDFYFNSCGLMVMTEKYHLERGYCCGNACCHCPFEFESVPEPRKTLLREERKKENISSEIKSSG